MTRDSTPWPWLVLGPNADMTSFTTLAATPTQDAALAFARAHAAAGRACVVMRIGHVYAAGGDGAAAPHQAPERASDRLSATVSRLRAKASPRDAEAGR